ncbi:MULTISPECIES: structural protein P5 [unclassified Pseudomonas]|uniref:structural protein P5 n=1 Tax=unclassified Pseudomonas TaxID=196821 RepID=UPI0025F1305C|nr:MULTISPECIES: structural protein P5 [unclassified Pseudomonas]
MPTIPRGVRNNNPGNIEYDPRNQWQGQLAPDSALEERFARFDTAENGIRALAKLILAYRSKAGIPHAGDAGVDTIREVISRWAPGVENDTEAYINALAAGVGAQPDQPIDIADRKTLIALTTGIILHENGTVPYAPSIIYAGVQRALTSLLL